MPSMTDLDQGGIARQWVNSTFGPSIGPTRVTFRTTIVLNTSAVNQQLDPSVDLVQCNAQTGNIFVTLPVIYPALPAQTGLFALSPIRFMDIAGTAATNFTQIFPQPNWSIGGLGLITLTTNWFGITLVPNPSTRVWIRM
jgi:hypothetical protein